MKVIVNPVIVKRGGGRTSRPEGCLSFPGRSTYMARHNEVVARWHDQNGKEQFGTFREMDAVCFEHETDHLDGKVLFP